MTTPLELSKAKVGDILIVDVGKGFRQRMRVVKSIDQHGSVQLVQAPVELSRISTATFSDRAPQPPAETRRCVPPQQSGDERNLTIAPLEFLRYPNPKPSLSRQASLQPWQWKILAEEIAKRAAASVLVSPAISAQIRDPWGALSQTLQSILDGEGTRWWDADRGRICTWCFYPRDSDKCRFGLKHGYVEMFAGVR